MIFNKIVLLIIYFELQLIWTQTTIPKSLRECYKNNVTLNPPIPLNLRILIDIIQKMEKYSYSTIDMRIMSSSILHRFRFDGIEYHKNIQTTENILPFSGTGIQRIKHKLIEELIPGKPEILPVHILSQEERCILHQAISSSILLFDNENKYKLYEQIPQMIHGIIQDNKE